MKNLLIIILSIVALQACKKANTEPNLLGTWQLAQIKSFDERGYLIEESKSSIKEYLQFLESELFNHIILNESDYPLYTKFELHYKFTNQALKLPLDQKLFNHSSLPVDFINDNSMKLNLNESTGKH